MNKPGNGSRLYMPQLDVLRLFAFLAVFTTHSLPSVVPSTHTGIARAIATVEHGVQSCGLNGVALFFLLSSFLITKLLMVERERTGSIHLKSFYIRRGLRIWPLYYLAILLGLLFPFILSTPFLTTGRTLAACFFMLNWDIALHGFTWNPIYPLWTVSCEEQFYGVWPLLMRAVSVSQLRMACMGAAACILLFAFWPHGLLMRHHAIANVAVFIYFPVGGLLALRSVVRERPLMGKTALSLGTAGVILWLVSGCADLVPALQARPVALEWVRLGAALPGTILLFEAWYRSSVRQWPRVLTYLGKISYGLYVFHVPCLLVIGTALARVGPIGRPGPRHDAAHFLVSGGLKPFISLALTIGVSMLSYRFFELPFLRLKDRYALVPSRAV